MVGGRRVEEGEDALGVLADVFCAVPPGAQVELGQDAGGGGQVLLVELLRLGVDGGQGGCGLGQVAGQLGDFGSPGGEVLLVGLFAGCLAFEGVGLGLVGGQAGGPAGGRLAELGRGVGGLR